METCFLVNIVDYSDCVLAHAQSKYAKDVDRKKDKKWKYLI